MFKTYIFCFSNTYTEVQKRADVIWKFQRYYLSQDYEQRVFLPPPLSLPLNVYQFVWSICSCIKKKRNQDHTDQGYPGQGRFHVEHVQTCQLDFWPKACFGELHLLRVIFIIARCTIPAINIILIPVLNCSISISNV